MGRSVIGLCMAFGSVVGGYVPVLSGASSFSLGVDPVRRARRQSPACGSACASARVSPGRAAVGRDPGDRPADERDCGESTNACAKSAPGRSWTAPCRCDRRVRRRTCTARSVSYTPATRPPGRSVDPNVSHSPLLCGSRNTERMGSCDTRPAEADVARPAAASSKHAIWWNHRPRHSRCRSGHVNARSTPAPDATRSSEP